VHWANDQSSSNNAPSEKGVWHKINLTGNLIPQIKWGMAKDILEQGTRPYITATLNFHLESLKADQYTVPDKTSGLKILYSQNYFQPAFAAGLGGFAFYNKDGRLQKQGNDETRDTFTLIPSGCRTKILRSS
jgi:hypothetical protein